MGRDMLNIDRQIPMNERIYLRELARKQAEYAALSVMEERKNMWYAVNDCSPGSSLTPRPPVIIETWEFNPDFMPENVYRCESEDGRIVEYKLLTNIRNHELIDDDKVMPDFYGINWQIDISDYGLPTPIEGLDDVSGRNIAYVFSHPVKDLSCDIHQLRPISCNVDREATKAHIDFLEELFGDILEIRIFGMPGGEMEERPGGLTYPAFQLMGTEAYFIAMHETPDLVHQLMQFLTDSRLRFMHWAENEGLLRLDNGNEHTGASYHFTHALPVDGYSGPEARLCDIWGDSASQETVGLSPEMFREFCFPYYMQACEPVGLLYYGCCEPVDVFWEDICKLPHLKKTSVSKWCNQKFMGEALKGTGIVFSRKPDPNFIGLNIVLDQNAWAAHIRETLDAAKDVPVEFIIRDVYTLHGDIYKARKAVKIARQQIDSYFS